ncbi:MAG: hypothetical protein HZA16_01345 [Nitrospirae bacterium]|nr:hypothetical protein [Nitrospirota bacterium]
MQCRVCGRPISEKIKKCICGYDREGWNAMDLDKTELEKKGVTSLKTYSSLKDEREQSR